MKRVALAATPSLEALRLHCSQTTTYHRADDSRPHPMKISSHATTALAITTAALLAACSAAGSSVAPSTGQQGATTTRQLQPLRLNGALVTAMRVGAGARPNQVIPESTKPRPFQYVASLYGGGSAIQYDYPTGTSPIGNITGLSDPQGECSTGKKTFCIVESGDDEIAKFAYGGTTPVATLNESIGAPASCAVDPNDGDLAATLLGGGLVIFKGGKGHGKAVSGLASSYFDGYDNEDDLFVDGFTGSYAAGLVEMAAGSKTFLFCADAGNDDVEVYKYPAGGPPLERVASADLPLSVVQVTK